MKVVLFCGGFGLRLREYHESVPKPMVPVGYRPILWHIMRYYAHFGHQDFVLCLGHRADVIKNYFLRYTEALSNDFVLSQGGQRVELLSSDIDDWRITFADSGVRANIGQRLRAVRGHLEGEELFLANYGDVVTDAPLNDLIEQFRASGKIAAFLSVRPTYTFHVVRQKAGGVVGSIQDANEADLWINGGYFIFRREIFDYIQPGDELVVEPFKRLIKEEQLLAFQYSGFWAPMDTLKDRETLEQLHDSGRPPWAVWLASGLS
ncbi:MAG TPA: sugar phosphate nucleotidyltransferase [Actinomycetes bacterium]|nr:sugar phosphate nucleotidyltransferase [Actinomycetes bacterium]